MCRGQVAVVDEDVNLVIESDLHLLSVVIIQLGAVPAQYVAVILLTLSCTSLLLLSVVCTHCAV